MILALVLAMTPLDAGRDLTRRFFAGELHSVWEQMTPQMQGAMKSEAQLGAFRAQVAAQLGAEKSLVSEKVEEVQGLQVYQRLAQFEKAPMTIEVRWALDSAGKVAGFFIKPAGPAHEAKTTHLGRHTRTRLTLPFEGAWTVVWGGTTLEQNYHAASRDQRFAYDLLIVEDGKTHTGPALKDYFAFGKVIVAPADGVVVEVVDGLPDQEPGKMDPAHAMGNHVVLDHGDGEFSFLCHFKQGSVAVKTGQAVKAGARLGLCGNSGNTSEPHLHYHLQDTARPFDGDGLPAEFIDYLADGKPVALGIPVKGQRIQRKP